MSQNPELPPVLTLHQLGPSSYLLRLFDGKNAPIAAKLAKEINMTNLLLVTPTETRQFNFAPLATAQEEVAGLPQSAPPQAAEWQDPMEAAMKMAEEAEPAPVPKPVKRKRGPDPSPGEDSQCGRCSGAGVVQMLLDGGQAAEGACPVCQGKGVIKKWGARR